MDGIPRRTHQHRWATSTVVLWFFIGMAVGAVLGYHILKWEFMRDAVNDRVSIEIEREYANN